ncbi:MAG: hypothetical protein ABI837_10920 [Acidobacteriota bacterium]
MIKNFFLAILMLLGITALHAQAVDGSGETTILIPISMLDPVPGAHGTLWKSELWVHNGLADSLTLKPCGFISPLCSLPLHLPGTTEQAFPSETLSQRGSLLITNIPAALAADVVLSSRLFELSRNAQPAGIALPVVREDHFFTKPSRFIAISSHPSLRAAIRIYDPSVLGVNDPRMREGRSLRLEVFAPDGRSLGASNAALEYRDVQTEASGFATIYDLAAMFPQVRGVARYDVRVTPLTPGMVYWAFVSVTDNDTQQVMLITAD